MENSALTRALLTAAAGLALIGVIVGLLPVTDDLANKCGSAFNANEFALTANNCGAATGGNLTTAVVLLGLALTVALVAAAIGTAHATPHNAPAAHESGQPSA